MFSLFSSRETTPTKNPNLSTQEMQLLSATDAEFEKFLGSSISDENITKIYKNLLTQHIENNEAKANVNLKQKLKILKKHTPTNELLDEIHKNACKELINKLSINTPEAQDLRINALCEALGRTAREVDLPQLIQISKMSPHNLVRFSAFPPGIVIKTALETLSNIKREKGLTRIQQETETWLRKELTSIIDNKVNQALEYDVTTAIQPVDQSSTKDLDDDQPEEFKSNIGLRMKNLAVGYDQKKKYSQAMLFSCFAAVYLPDLAQNKNIHIDYLKNISESFPGKSAAILNNVRLFLLDCLRPPQAGAFHPNSLMQLHADHPDLNPIVLMMLALDYAIDYACPPGLHAADPEFAGITKQIHEDLKLILCEITPLKPNEVDDYILELQKKVFEIKEKIARQTQPESKRNRLFQNVMDNLPKIPTHSLTVQEEKPAKKTLTIT